MALTQIQNAMTQLLGNSSGALSIDSSGNMGIGNTAQTQAKLLSYPSANQVGLMVYGNGTAGYPAFGFSGQVTSNGGRGAGMYLPDDGVLAWSTGGSERMRIDASGNLGLGVTPSAWQSQISVFQFGSGGILKYGGGSNLDLGNNFYFNNGPKYIFNGRATTYIQNGGQHEWHTSTSGTAGNAITWSQVMTLDVSGNLGVGTSSPYSINGSTVVTIGGSSTSTTGKLFLRDGSNNNQVQIYVDSSFNEFDSQKELNIRTETGALRFTTVNTERGRFDSSGNFGIGTTSPDSKLSVAGRIRFGNMYMQGITGYKDNNTSAFDMFDITGLGGHGMLKVSIAHHHSGGGQHGTVREFVMVLNVYTDVLIPVNVEQNFGGGLGFTISRPSSDVVRIRCNGNSVYGSGFFMQAIIQSNYAFGISNVGMSSLG